ncbi:hypothetical protein [Pseudobutyrivibrio xylanivorans]|uniref:Uncharacterized protein n=1 Tax=Pseudobutyrivibrio xylanivorans TaxID=185007 RepID=A0A1G5RTB8_PSEXY|nr:hypothetical protein [Pseudobutyrivibrio xylanivorans]SCZ77365.1 hypothetical protein SAMN02910350_00698 [Pseudobutyrivibrio xylanivorans]
MNLFMIILFLVVFSVCALFSFGAWKYNQGHYDERQELLRGKANKYSCSAMLIFLGVYFCYDILFGDYLIRLSASMLALLTICLGVIVFTSYSIWNEAYNYVNTNQKSSFCFVLFAFLSLLNIGTFILGFSDMNRYEIVVDKIIEFKQPFSQLFVGITFGSMALIYFIKGIVNKLQED